MRLFQNLAGPPAQKASRFKGRCFQAAVENIRCCLSTNRGNILVYIVVVMLIFAALGVTMLSLFSASTSSTAVANSDRRAFDLYESGYRYALSELTGTGFSSSTVTTLNTTTYSLSPNGQFLLDIFGPWFNRIGSLPLSAGDPLNLRVPRGKLPAGFAIPAVAPHVSVVNFDYVSSISAPGSSAEVTGYTYTDPTHFSLTVGDDFGAINNERVCLAVHPDQAQTVSDGGNLTVALQAQGIFPKFNGAIQVNNKRLFYRERVDDPINLKTTLTHLKAKSGIFPVTVAVSDYVILSPANYYIVPEGRSGGVTYGASMDYAVSAYDYDGRLSGTEGDPDFDSEKQVGAGAELSTVLSKTEFGSGFAGVDDAGRRVTFRRTSGTPFGSVFFKDTRAIGGQNGFCQSGRCLFNDGIRAFFVMTFTGVGDGFTFSLLSAEPNPLDGNSLNNTASSVGGDFQLGELLGYAGDSRTDPTPTYLDGTGNGLRPPKMAVQFDGHTNNQNSAYCADSTHVNVNTRFDPDFSVSSRDTVQYVFWGSRSPIIAPCRANKASYDDNRHDVKDPTAEELWPFVTGTAEVRPKPAVSPSDGTIYVGSGTQGVNDGRAFAINPDGTQKWVFNSPGSGDTEFRSSPALDSNGNIYIGSNDNHLYSLQPANGNQNWGASLSGNVKSGPAVDETQHQNGTTPTPTRVYVGSDNKFYAIRKSDGSILWMFPSDSTTHNYFSPTVDPYDGTIYVGSSDDLLHALNPDGTQKWRYPSSGTISTIEGAPRISTESDPALRKIYFGSNDNNVYALNRSGAFQWSRSIDGNVVTTPALTTDNLTVYAGSLDGHLYALNSPNGTIKWKYPPGATGLDPIRSSPAIDFDGTVYFGTDGGKLYAVNPDGTLKWIFPDTGSIGAIRSSPTIGPNGIIYFGSDDGKVYAIDPFVDPRNIRNLYLTAAELGVTQSDNWFESGTWAVRVEVDRSQTVSKTVNGIDYYEYTLRTWMRKCTDSVNCSDIVGTLFTNTRLRYDYKPLALTALPMTQTIELAGADHTLFNRFLFGFTSGSGSDQTINISKIQLSFIRPADPVIDSDPAWP